MRKTRADCHVQDYRGGWIVWAKNVAKPQLCNVRVNCAGRAHKAPKPAFDCVDQRCVRNESPKPTLGQTTPAAAADLVYNRTWLDTKSLRE